MTKEKEYLTLDEAAGELGIKRSTLYLRIKELKMELHKFKFDRKSYLSQVQLKQLKELKEKPWLIG